MVIFALVIWEPHKALEHRALLSVTECTYATGCIHTYNKNILIPSEASNCACKKRKLEPKFWVDWSKVSTL